MGTDTTQVTNGNGTGAQQETPVAEQLASVISELRGAPDVVCDIYRLDPKMWNGAPTRGFCETVSWIDDPDTLIDYIRRTWGGQRFRVSPKVLDTKTSRYKIHANVVLEFATEPLNHGKTYGAPGSGSVSNHLMGAAPATDVATSRPLVSDKAIEIVERSAMQRAQSAESSANERVKILADQLSSARDEIRELRDRLHKAEGEARGAILEARREGELARERVERTSAEQRDAHGKELGSVREQYRSEIDRIRDEHRREVDRLRDDIGRIRDDARKESESARAGAQQIAGLEIQRIRDDSKDRLDRVEKAYESQLRDKKEQIDRMHTELLEARKAAMQKDDMIVQAKKLAEFQNAMADAGLVKEEKEVSTTDKILESLPDIAEAAPAIAGAASSLLRGALGFAPAAQATPSPQQLAQAQAAQVQAARQAQVAQAQRKAAQQRAAAESPEAKARDKARQMAAVKMQIAGLGEFQHAIAQLEAAINSDTPPQSFAMGLISSTPPEVVARIAEQDPAQIVELVEAASSSSVIASLRGKQYLVNVIGAIRAELLRRSQATQSAESTEPSAESNPTTVDDII